MPTAATALRLITPAVSPIFGQNPAFRTVVYDAAGGILDQTTYDLTNLAEATAAAGGVSAGMAAGIHLHPAMEPAAGRSAEPRPPLFADDRRHSGTSASAGTRSSRYRARCYWAPFSRRRGQLAQAVRRSAVPRATFCRRITGNATAWRLGLSFGGGGWNSAIVSGCRSPLAPRRRSTIMWRRSTMHLRRTAKQAAPQRRSRLVRRPSGGEDLALGSGATTEDDGLLKACLRS